MGIYINPKDRSKEEYLRDHAFRSPFTPATHLVEVERSDRSAITTCVVVCLVDNGWMTAAGIAYSQRELEAFLHEDGRPKTWWFLPLEHAGEWMDISEIEGAIE